MTPSPSHTFQGYLFIGGSLSTGHALGLFGLTFYSLPKGELSLRSWMQPRQPIPWQNNQQLLTEDERKLEEFLK